MAYIINSTNGSVITTVADGTIDQQATSITLVGQNYAGYGEFINENFVKLLENFSSNTAPAAPLAGQLWWDTTTGVLKAYTGIAWKNIPSTHMGSSQPVQFTFGDLWWDTTSNQLKVCDQAGVFKPAGGSLTLSGDITGTGSGAVTTALSTTGVTAGNYGTASSTPTLSVDAKGRITSASNTSINITSSQVSNFASTARTSVSANSGLTYNSTTGVFGVDTSVIPSAASGGSALVGYLPSGTGAVATTAQTKLRESVSVLDFIPLAEQAAIAAGSSAYDCTTSIQSAINASYNKTLFFPSGKYIISAVSVIQSGKFSGEAGSVIIHKAGSSSDMVTISGASTKFSAVGITFNGNESNQTSATTRTIFHNAVGTGTDPSEFVITGCHFINGNYADIGISTDSNLLTFDTVQIRDNTFFGGREGTSTIGPRYIHISSACDVQITDNNFNLGYTPLTYGRAGIVSFLSGYVGGSSRGVISGNFLRNAGRSSVDALGAIDGYSGSQDIVIDGNTLINPYGRGIQVKSDAAGVVISNNVVSGLYDLHGGTGVDAQITVNRSTTTDVGGSVLIEGNVCRDSEWDGISVSEANTDYTASANNLVVTGNIISGATRRGIGVYNSKHASIIGNMINGGCDQYGIIANGYVAPSATLITNNTVSGVSGIGIYCSTLQYLTVTSNVARSNIGVDIYVTITNMGIVRGNSFLSNTPINTGAASGVANVVFVDNICTSLISAGLYRQTITTGAIDATLPFLQVNTEADAVADDLTTINGGYEGMHLTLRSYSNSRVVTVLGGGNLVLASTMVLSNNLKTISFIKVGASWYEISRSDNV